MSEKNTEGGLKEGIKYDDGKVRLELLSRHAIEKLGQVLTFGAKKYEDNNWRRGLLYTRVIGALLRHTFAYLSGETTDKESGLSHMAHAMCCAMFLLEYEVSHPELDDRYKGDK